MSGSTKVRAPRFLPCTKLTRPSTQLASPTLAVTRPPIQHPPTSRDMELHTTSKSWNLPNAAPAQRLTPRPCSPNYTSKDCWTVRLPALAHIGFGSLDRCTWRDVAQELDVRRRVFKMSVLLFVWRRGGVWRGTDICEGGSGARNIS